MTPKEKAFDLVTTYSRILPMNLTTLLDHKNCASVAVNEILETVNYQIKSISIGTDTVVHGYGYWTEVREEIEKL